jgi:hypothetical protein
LVGQHAYELGHTHSTLWVDAHEMAATRRRSLSQPGGFAYRDKVRLERTIIVARESLDCSDQPRFDSAFPKLPGNACPAHDRAPTEAPVTTIPIPIATGRIERRMLGLI